MNICQSFFYVPNSYKQNNWFPLTIKLYNIILQIRIMETFVHSKIQLHATKLITNFNYIFKNSHIYTHSICNIYSQLWICFMAVNYIIIFSTFCQLPPSTSIYKINNHIHVCYPFMSNWIVHFLIYLNNKNFHHKIK